MPAPVSPQDKQLIQTGSTMALAAYGNTPPPGWVPLVDPLTGNGLTSNTASGFQAQAYINSNPNDKRIWVAVAGTNDGKDVAAWNSAVTGWNGGASQFKDGLDYAAKINNLVQSDPQYSGYSISTSGHSFGEAFAQLFTHTFGWNGVGYDGVGAGAIINSTGYTQYLTSQNITAVGGTNFVACSTSGIGPFGGGVVGLAGSNIAGTRQCSVSLESSTSSGILNIISTVLTSNPLLGYVLGKLVLGVKLHDMSGIDQAIQNGSFDVAPDAQTIPTPGVVFPRLDPFAINDGQGNMFSTLVDSNGNVVKDANGNPVFNLEMSTGTNTKVAFHVADKGASVTAPDGSQTLFSTLTPIGNAVTSYAPPLMDALSFLKAIQTGQPLPIVASGLRIVNDITSVRMPVDPKNPSGATYLQPTSAGINGAANVAGGILSVMSLEAALRRGDTMGAIVAGAQTISASASAYVSLTQNIVATSATDFTTTALGDTAGSAINGLNTALPYLNLVNSIVKGDAVGSAMAVMSMFPATAPIAVAYYAFEMITSLFGDNSVPDPWGSGHYVWNGMDTGISAVGATGGDQAVSGFMSQMLGSMNSMIAQVQQQNPGSSLGLIPNRMPSLSYGMQGYNFTDIDPLTGVQKNPGLRFDTTGKPYNAAAGSPESFMSLGQAFISSAIARGAIAPQWEVRTADCNAANDVVFEMRRVA